MASATQHAGTGLYDSRNEHDACGVGFVADLTGERRHQTIANALTVLRNLDHRGAKGADRSPATARILTDARRIASRPLCSPLRRRQLSGRAGVPARRTRLPQLRPMAAVQHIAAQEGWPSSAGARFRTTVFGERGKGGVAAARPASRVGTGCDSGTALDRKAYCLASGPSTRPGCTCGLGGRDVVYKGMLTALSWSASSPTCRTRCTSQRSRSCMPGSPRTRSVLAAGAPVPADRAQRRDQHDPRQPQLDARAGGTAVARARHGHRRARHRAAGSDHAGFNDAGQRLS